MKITPFFFMHKQFLKVLSLTKLMSIFPDHFIVVAFIVVRLVLIISFDKLMKLRTKLEQKHVPKISRQMAENSVKLTYHSR